MTSRLSAHRGRGKSGDTEGESARGHRTTAPRCVRSRWRRRLVGPCSAPFDHPGAGISGRPSRVRRTIRSRWIERGIATGLIPSSPAGKALAWRTTLNAQRLAGSLEVQTSAAFVGARARTSERDAAPRIWMRSLLRVVIPREQLNKEVWTEPMTRGAARVRRLLGADRPRLRAAEDSSSSSRPIGCTSSTA